MTVLALSDIHSNYRALKATLNRFGDADAIWCLGDILEYGPCPKECLDLVRESCSCVVLGNHDLSTSDWQPGTANVWAEHGRQVMTRDDIAYLHSLPLVAKAATDGVSYLLVHGSPEDPLKGSLTPHTGPAALEEATACEEQAVLCAHTHTAMVREASGKQVINTGTIGQPRDGDYRAQCMLIEEGRLSFHRVEYDLEALADDYRRSDLPEHVRTEWLRYTREGVVPVHGLQLGPFSVPRGDGQ